MSENALEDLKAAMANQEGYVELRWHARTTRSFTMMDGRLEGSTSKRRAGTGVRVLEDGAFGFAAVSSHDPKAVRAAIDRARAAARKSAARKRTRIKGLQACHLATGHFEEPGVADVLSRGIEEKLDLAQKTEATTRAASKSVRSATSTYQEILEEKAILTTDGAACSVRLVRPEFRVTAVAERDGERQTSSRTIGATGGWDCLFEKASSEALGTAAAATAVDLLSAKRPAGGRAKVLLAPSIVGLLVHEAIGHTVEADFVDAGSVAAGKLGQMVASEKVTLCDSGKSEHHGGAGGTLPVDDEGVLAERTPIIEQGKLVGYLHDRESAARYGVAPTGSARAWEYSDVPLIRMRNTYIEPGEEDLGEMIGTMDDGYILEGAKNGQADATGEFMFNVERATRVKKGKKQELLRGVTITGIAFDVMRTVDAVSREFEWDLGAGYCGKGQPAKVDAGGPWVRCEVLLGGDQ